MIYIRQDFVFHILMTFDFIMITRESDFIHAKAKGIIYLTPSILYLINLTPCTFHPFSFQTSIQTNISSAPSLSIPTNNASSSSSSSSPPPQTPIPQTHKPYISRSPQVSTNYPNNPISHPSLPPRPLPQNTIAHHTSHITHHTYPSHIPHLEFHCALPTHQHTHDESPYSHRDEVKTHESFEVLSCIGFISCLSM